MAYGRVLTVPGAKIVMQRCISAANFTPFGLTSRLASQAFAGPIICRCDEEEKIKELSATRWFICGKAHAEAQSSFASTSTMWLV